MSSAKPSRHRSATTETNRGATSYAPIVIVFLAALGVRLLHIDRPLFWDELYHILAARSLVENGTLVLVDGGAPYPRAWPYTHAVAWMFRLFGEGLVVARLLSVISGTILVAALFAAVRYAANTPSAWLAALFLCLDPLAITASQIYRFYPAHALFFFIAAAAVFRITSEPVSKKTLIAGTLIGAGSLIVALQLQWQITLLGSIGLLAWLALVLGPRAIRRLRRSPNRWGIPLLLVLLVGSIVFAIAQYDALETLWRRYQTSAEWAVERADRITYYHGNLLGLYPSLWTLFPLLVLVAAVRHPKVSLFSALLFGVVLLELSFGGQKSQRYLFFVMPAFFTVAAIALAEGVPAIRDRLASRLARHVPPFLSRRTRTFLGWVLIVAVVLFAVGANRAFVHTGRMLATPNGSTYGAQPNWPAVVAWYATSADSPMLVLSSAPLKALYYLGRVEVSLESRELRGGPEFRTDRYTRRPVVSKPESLEMLMECVPRGLIFIEDSQWKRPWYVSERLAEYLTARTNQVPTPSGWGVRIFRWENSIGTPPHYCASLPLP